MKLNLLLCTFFFPVLAHGQENYIAYHREIIQAENHFLSGNIKGSINKYRQLIEQYEKAFAKDCFIALELACMERDTANARFFFKACFTKGVPWESLSLVNYITELLRLNPDYKDDIYQNYISERRRYLQKIDFPTRMAIVAMLKKDDLYKNIPVNWKGKKAADTLLVQVNENNAKEFVALTKRVGIPGQHSVGIKDYELDLSCDPDLFRDLGVVFDRILLHYGCSYFMLSKELQQAVRDGELHPREYALFYEFSYHWFAKKSNNPSENNYVPLYKLKCTVPEKDKDYAIFMFSPGQVVDTTFANKCRTEIGISTIQHDVEKARFAKQNNLILFFGLFRDI